MLTPLFSRSHNFNWDELILAVEKLCWKAADLEAGHPIYKAVSDLRVMIHCARKEEEKDATSISSENPARQQG